MRASVQLMATWGKAGPVSKVAGAFALLTILCQLAYLSKYALAARTLQQKLAADRRARDTQLEEPSFLHHASTKHQEGVDGDGNADDDGAAGMHRSSGRSSGYNTLSDRAEADSKSSRMTTTHMQDVPAARPAQSNCA